MSPQVLGIFRQRIRKECLQHRGCCFPALWSAVSFQGYLRAEESTCQKLKIHVCMCSEKTQQKNINTKRSKYKKKKKKREKGKTTGSLTETNEQTNKICGRLQRTSVKFCWHFLYLTPRTIWRNTCVSEEQSTLVNQEVTVLCAWWCGVPFPVPILNNCSLRTLLRDCQTLLHDCQSHLYTGGKKREKFHTKYPYPST